MEEEGVGEEDRISRLPEPLIHHILSLLPTKCVVATTVLARGWNNLWISLPVLDFREWKFPGTQETLSSTNSFMDFMDRVLLLRNMSDIKKFCLTCNGEYFNDQRIKGWITTAIQCRVEELIVCRCGYVGESSDIIPVDLYTCESLTLLDIEFFDDTLYLPQLIYFPRLKILRLSEISFCNEKFTQQLFSGCPVLEELSLRYCSWKRVSLISSTLKVLTLVGCLRICAWFGAVTKIDAPNLMSITINDVLGESLVVDSFPSLVDADIHRIYSEEDDGVDVIPNFVKKLSNIKHLKLSGTVFQNLELANALSASFPTFINLTTMEVSVIKTQQVGSFFTFLQFSPNLESLVFSGVCCRDEVSEDVLTLDVVPHCLLVRLKSIKFQNFKGELKELDLVQLFLQNAKLLQTVSIDISSQSFVNSEKRQHTAKDVEDFNERIMERLLKCKWASVDCVVKLSSSPYSYQNR
ncbi:hypothetical protein MKW92_017296 [Papaver armeniacum]|nr:hypothetical protein MKW92_017296 [Papaver armeniacum]